jgi:hypothetical protein
MAAQAHGHVVHNRATPGSGSLIVALVALGIAGLSFAAPSQGLAVVAGMLAMVTLAFATVTALRNDDAMAGPYGPTSILLGILTFLAVSVSVFHWPGF